MTVNKGKAGALAGVVGTLIGAALLAAFLATAKAGTAAPADGASPVTLDGARQYTLTVGDRALRLLVWRPAGDPPAGGFPVLYTFDGDYSFGLFADMAASLSDQVRRAGKAPAIVVALAYPAGEASMDRRTYDLTAASDRADGSFELPERPNDRPWPPVGGGDAFLDILEHEVKPFVAARFPVDPSRETLYGHSLGGQMVLHALFTRPDSFDAYVASSPSIWMNGGQALREAEAFLGSPARPERQPIPLRLTVGGAEQELSEWDRMGPWDVAKREKWVAGNRMVDNARDLARLIGRDGTGRIALTFEVLEGENHHSVRPISTYRGILFAIGR